jgi:hypothetical protein
MGLLRKKPVKCYVWRTAWYGAEIWTLRKVVRSTLILNVLLEKEGDDQLDQQSEK